MSHFHVVPHQIRSRSGSSGNVRNLSLVVVDIDIVHAAARRDPILPTQRIGDIKISMVGIYKVKVRLLPVSLAHVSHFSEPEPWAYKQWTHFSGLEILKLLQLPALLLSLAHMSHFFPEREPWAQKQCTHFAVLDISRHLLSPAPLLSLDTESTSGHLFAPFCALSPHFWRAIARERVARSAVDLATSPLLDMLFKTYVRLGPPSHIYLLIEKRIRQMSTYV